MKNLLLLFALVAFSSFHSTNYAQKVKIPCPTTLNDINDCPDTGCGNVDPHLNRQKNIRSLDGEAEAMTIAEMRKLPDPVKGFKVGNTREKEDEAHLTRANLAPLIAFNEVQKVRMTGILVQGSQRVWRKGTRH